MNRKLSPAWTLAILTGLNLFNYVDRAVLNAVRTPMATEFGINYQASGIAFTAFMVGYFVTSPLFGYLGDRASRKWLIAIGIFVWSLGTVLTGFAGTFTVLLAYRVLVGVGEASYATISPGLISDTFESKRRNNALTIFFVAIPVGYALGYLFGGEMSKHFGWRSAFIWAGAPGLLLALILLPFREPERGQADANSQAALTKPSLKEFLKLFGNGKYMLVVWGYVAYTFALGAFSFWGPTFLEQVHGLPLYKADRFFGAVIVVAGLLGTLGGGFVATAWQKRNRAGYAWMLAGSMLLAVPTALLALWTADKTLAMSFLAAAIFLLFVSTGPVNTLIIETVPVNLRSSAMALSIFMIHLFGDMWSSAIVGGLADYWHNLQRAVLILPAALLVGALLWLWLAVKTMREKKDAKMEDGRNEKSRVADGG
ncbi:MAG: Major facilitator superfamily 1 [Pedosphaera sp.]|nr:Major facilitator superfamily 1 [Pedosphaera sp.]